ncbi:MAG: Flp pilus assembly complex ATPase component TadA [Deltaproteobacteria bacterium]|nr:Flp pilus assembly complex ATPase component TadA [Deltaproteobacteria bacterium]
MDVNTRTKEAEVYYSMGLTVEALGIYEQILSESPELDAKGLETITEKIGRLKKEIADREKTDGRTVSAEEVSAFKESLSGCEEVPAILDSASAFKELGLFADAVSEYEKLFRLEYPVEMIVPDLVECLLRLHSPSKAVEEAEKIVSDHDLGKKEMAQINFRLGLEMEERNHKDLALELYESAGDLDPKNGEIKNKISSVIASISSGSKYDYLLNQKMVNTEQLQKALALSKKTRKSVEWILIEQFKVKKEAVGKSLSFFYGCPFRIYDPELPKPIELIGNLKKTFLLHELWVPLNWGKEGIELLIDDPRDLNKTDHIRTLLKTKKINFSVAIKEDIENFVKMFFDEKKRDDSGPMENMEDEFDLIPDVSFEEEEEVEEDIEEIDEASGQVVKLVDQVLVAAFRKGASDIHIEPSPLIKTTSVRFRMDGVCQEYIQVPNSMARGILSRIKIMAGLDIAERRLPQDGKIKFKRKGIPSFELRVATLPTTGGFEDVVLRILAKAGAMKMDEMGLNERNLKLMKEIVSQPYGLVLVVGPTGSGKTTSLHAALGHINKPSIKIWTAEDPVEITQLGLRQVEAKPKIGLDFERIMRAFLRADPDVIMIGEMRDQETASIGVEASLTGHLVFSTLHTNSAPETVTRLLDMGLNPLNFSDSFLGVMAQRLIRRLCKECREEYHPSEEEFEEILSDYGKEFFEATGIEFTSDLTLYRPGGCDVCSGTGYKGRLGIHELMAGTPEIRSMIKKQADSEMLFEQAIKDGMTTLKQDGIMKAFQGLTDISEIRRVCIN